MSFVGAAITVGAGLYQANRADHAADKQTEAYDAATAEQRRQFDLVWDMLQPQRQVGNAALGQLSQLYGLGTLQPPTSSVGSTGIGVSPEGTITQGVRNPRIGNGGNWSPFFGSSTQPPQSQAPTLTPGNGTPNFSGFFTSPGYEFRRSEGNRGIENSFAARGGALSGNALRALNEFNSNLASGEFGNYVNQLNNLAGFGQVANSTGANAALQTGANIGNNFIGAGNARASGIANQSNAVTDTLGSLLQFGGYGGSGGGGWGGRFPGTYGSPGFGGGWYPWGGG